MTKLFIILAILLSLVIRIFFISQSKHVADVYLMYTMGTTYLEGKNPYLVLDFNSYPPLAIFLEAASAKISIILHTSFVNILKFWPNLADFITAFIIYKFLRRNKSSFNKAAFWSIGFLLNPISIIISSAHGQIDSIPSLLLLLSIYILTISKKVYLAALFLGLAIAIKPNPAMLIPMFLFFRNMKLQQNIIFLMVTLSPLVLTIIPFLDQKPLTVIFRVLSYSGVNDLSYAAILRGIWYQNNAVTNLPLTNLNLLLESSKYIFLTGAFCLTLILAGGKNLAKSSMIIYLFFLSFYFGIGSQYLVWILPLAFLIRERMIFYYILFGIMALFGFYLFFGPDILLGNFYTLVPFQTKYIYIYFLGNLVFWLLNLVWLGKIIVNLSDTIRTLSLIRQRLMFITFCLFILSLLPMINLLTQLFKLNSLEV